MHDAGMTEKCAERDRVLSNLRAWRINTESVGATMRESTHSVGATAAVHSGNSVTKAVAKFTVLQPSKGPSLSVHLLTYSGIKARTRLHFLGVQLVCSASLPLRSPPCPTP